MAANNCPTFQPYVSSFDRVLAEVQGTIDAANGGQGGPGFSNGFPTNGISGAALFAATCPGNTLVERWKLMQYGWAPSPPAPDLSSGAALCGGCPGNKSTF